MKKINKILDMFNELFETQISSDEAIFIVANSFYTSKDEKINRDTLFRYIKSQMDIELFHRALNERDISIIDPVRYSKNNISNSYKNEIKKEKSEDIKNINFSEIDLINEINSLKEKLDLFTQKYSSEKNILDISKDMLSISEDDVKRATFRIEEGILKEFEIFCDEHREYKKTVIINFMIKEFLEKYKK
ncbi:hypothetical protein [Fusobacterium sp.]|uniref:hypothetical protein n=1 Tax=Fusobacterium sp. TaxID=68766 RepID=UPI0026331278|nr:hypothetical protein [Fusobacterium sp.]